MDDSILQWWRTLLRLAALGNVIAWCWAFARLRRRRASLSCEEASLGEQLALLAAVYVLGCAFRSFLPVVDAPRICLSDAALSRIVIGRSVATIAELCFAAQWAVLLQAAALHAGSRAALRASQLLLPMIVLAELSCWYAVLTTNYFFHLVENGLWTLSVAVVLACFPLLWTRLTAPHRRWFSALALGGVAYVAFMLSADLPMYYGRWQADRVSARAYLDLAEGARQILGACVLNRSWEAWRQDISWLTLYFTFAVWSSIALMHFPEFDDKR